MHKFILTVVVLALSGVANATVIDFDARESTSLVTSASYSEDGFTFISSDTGSSAFVSWGSTDTGSTTTGYTGSAAMFNNYADETTFLTADDGSAFDLNAIDLAEVYNKDSYAATEVIFTATLAAGGSASYTAVLDLVFGNQTVNFGSVFNGVTSVSWDQTYNYHQFDNLVINEDAGEIPEPVSLAILGFGLLGLGVVRRK